MFKDCLIFEHQASCSNYSKIQGACRILETWLLNVNLFPFRISLRMIFIVADNSCDQKFCCLENHLKHDSMVDYHAREQHFNFFRKLSWKKKHDDD